MVYLFIHCLLGELTLKELSKMSLKEMEEMLKSKTNAAKLYGFFNNAEA